MKLRVLFLAGSVLAVISLMAQVPQGMNYQAIARKANGAAMPNQPIGIEFTIHSGSPTGTVVYKETDTATTNEFGLFTTVIGGGTVLSGTFAAINWGSSAMFLNIAIDLTGTGNYINVDTKQLESVPYALFSGGGSGSSPWVTSSNNIYNTNTGLVGIGTSSPGSILDINGAANYSVLNLNSNTNTLITVGSDDTTDFFLQYRSGATYFYNQGASDMSFGVSQSADMLHLSGGSQYIGIGTTTPWKKLDVVGDVSAGNPATSTAYLYLRTSGDTSYLEGGLSGLIIAGGQAVSDPALFFSNVVNAVEPLYNNHTSLGAAGDYFTAVYATNGSIQTSDARMKKNVQNLSMGLKEVMALRPVSYEWKNVQSGEGEKIGFIAQEVEKVVPQAVVHDYISDKQIDAMKIMKKPLPEIRDPYAMSYSEMIPVLTRAIQEQQAQIEKLQKEVERLSNR